MNYDNSAFVTINPFQVPIVARFVRKGDRYGREGCLIHNEEEPLVEFYDGRYDFDKWTGFVGQFISRYCLSTIVGHEGGLCLDGGVPEWILSGENMRDIRTWICMYHEEDLL